MRREGQLRLSESCDQVAAVQRHRGRSRQQVGGRLKVDPSNVTGVVDRLEKVGLLQRGAGTADRRVKTLALTPAGRQLREDMYAAIAAQMPAFRGLTDAELDSLLELLNKAWDACTEHDSAESGRAGMRAALI